MKSNGWLACIFFLLLEIAVRPVHAQRVLAPARVPETAQAADVRREIPLSDGWLFHKGDLADGAAMDRKTDPAEAWDKVIVPHCWNATDGQDGGNDYYRGECWYRRTLNIDASMAGKELFLRFEGANRKAEVFINGQSVGNHAGGEAAFCFDITSAVHPGENQLAVKVSNRDDPAIPPLSADFTFFGGIYRPVSLLVLDPVHISPMDFASAGVYITTPQVNAQSATVQMRVLVQNSGKEQKTAVLLASMQGADGYGSATLDVPAGQTRDARITMTVNKPHLWDGRRDPFMYRADLGMVTQTPGGVAERTDRLAIPFGIRTFSVDAEKGFILNGKPYDLHGVDRHQDRLDKGWAISDADQTQDMEIIKEMGCTGIRLAHYEQSDFFYGLADKAGIVVWAEVPVVNSLGAGGVTTEAFTKNAQQQYTELIRQNFNHPAICFWSAGNEVDPPRNTRGRPGQAPPSDVFAWFRNMAELEKTEDPSRLSTVAWREAVFPPADVSDVFGLNAYLGWYNGTPTGGWEGLENYIQQHSQNGNKGKWAMSEYGAGASIYFHSEHPMRMDHTEEYQCLFHENYWKVLSKHPEIWGKFVWCMFDFAVDSRAEGDHAGRNDKGLVTYDRKTKKDAFYFYKAVWSQEPFVYIAGRRFTVRGSATISVKVYTNRQSVSLFVNGRAAGTKSPENGTIVWDGVVLQEGKNVVNATAGDEKLYGDQCEWTYAPGAPAEVYVAQDDRMKRALQAGPPRAR